jgi:hypothetical protein
LNYAIDSDEDAVGFGISHQLANLKVMVKDAVWENRALQVDRIQLDAHKNKPTFSKIDTDYQKYFDTRSVTLHYFNTR